VEQARAHLGLVGGGSDQPHLAFRPFATDEMILIVPPGHAWAARRRVPLEQLRGEPLILREAGSGSRRCLEQALEHSGLPLKNLRVGLELGSNEAIKEAVRRGLGIAFLSALAVAADVQTGRLHTLGVTGLTLRRELCLVWDRRRALPIPAQRFLDFVPKMDVP
jgi:DNA-binding transcriptional LysR family regulator